MSRSLRRERAKRILADLDALRGEWGTEGAECPSNESALARRERFKLLEAEMAILRLLQAESRLVQQVFLGVGGFVSGSLVTLLIKHLLEK